MSISCSSCGVRCDDSARFCPSCGQALGGLVPPDPHADAPTFEPAVVSPGMPAALRAVRADEGRGVAGRDLTGRFEPGMVLAGRYRIVALLGRGGMGEVYRADDLTLGQPVALKFLPRDMGNEPDRLTRFRSEVSIARQVSHPNVCRVYDIGEVDGLTFLSMEYIDGEDLASLLRRIGRLPPDKGLEIARQVCAGLAAAHDRGVIHRDLKPGNVMIDGRGDARIADFGLAAAFEPIVRRTASSRIAPEAIAGTPAYMAPEQFEGRPVSVQSDIYALGLVLYEIFTGTRAFTGSTVAEFAELHRERTPSSMTALVSELDPAIERTIQRCLEKEPSARPPSALAVAASLPGGDPLAAAIARGETPAPEVVAAAGSLGLVKPVYALALLGLCVAALVSLVIAAGYLQPARIVPLPDSPEILRHRARQIVQALGYPDTPSDTSSGFTYAPYLREIQSEPWRKRWEHLRAADPAAIYFWYRQSPDPLEPWGQTNTRVDPTNPPETRPGMVSVQIDPSRGRLYRFLAVPPRGSHSDRAGASPDWAATFQQAGLDLSRFTPSTPAGVPPVYGDMRAAWDGTASTSPGVRLHVEAAALGGRLVYFERVQRAADGARANAPAQTPARWFLNVFMPVFLLGMLGTALLLAVRNLRLARGDRRGAFRIATFLFLISFVSVIAGADLNADFGVLFNIVMAAIMQALVLAASAWVAYIALEPHVRRRMPHALISWSRLLSGRWRDPLVARDTLVAVTIGLWLQVWFAGAEFAAGSVAGFSPVWPLDGFRFALTLLLNETARSVLGGLAFFVLLFALTLVVRRQWMAAAIVVLLLAADSASVNGAPLAGAIASAVAWAIVMLALWRFGLLMLVVTVFVGNVVGKVPLTFDPSIWFAPAAYLAMGLLVGLALFGAWTSANLRTVFPRVLGE